MNGGSTIDSTLTSIAKLAGRNWRHDSLDAAPRNITTGRVAMIAVPVVGRCCPSISATGLAQLAVEVELSFWLEDETLGGRVRCIRAHGPLIGPGRDHLPIIQVL